MDYELLTDEEKEAIRLNRLGTLERQAYEYELALGDAKELEKSKDEKVKDRGRRMRENAEEALAGLEAEITSARKKGKP